MSAFDLTLILQLPEKEQSSLALNITRHLMRRRKYADAAKGNLTPKGLQRFCLRMLNHVEDCAYGESSK